MTGSTAPMYRCIPGRRPGAAFGLEVAAAGGVVQNSDRRMLGVQWHPECLPIAPESGALFGWLVSSARAFASRTR